MSRKAIKLGLRLSNAMESKGGVTPPLEALMWTQKTRCMLSTERRAVHQALEIVIEPRLPIDARGQAKKRRTIGLLLAADVELALDACAALLARARRLFEKL